MPALPDVAQVLRITLSGDNEGSEWLNVFHVSYASTPMTPSDLITVLNDFEIAYKNRFLPLLSVGLRLTAGKAVDLTSSTAPVAEESFTDSGSVTTGTSLPASAAAGISWVISRRYRGGHPRTYIPGLTSADLQSGTTNTLAATFQGNLQSAAGSFLADIEAIGVGGRTYVPVCVHYFRHGALLTPPLVDNITGAAVHPRMDSQRRRLGKERV